jgi:hypothetical protein
MGRFGIAGRRGGDDTWFIWLTPGSAQQLTLEGACSVTNGLIS